MEMQIGAFFWGKALPFEKSLYFCPNLKYNFNIVQLHCNNMYNRELKKELLRLAL